MSNVKPATHAGVDGESLESEGYGDDLPLQDGPHFAWSAVHDFFPPRPPHLRVTGEVQTPTPGYKLTLKKAVPQGINPQILLLRLERQAPTGIEPQHVVTMKVEYDEQTDVRYTQVQIEPDGIAIEVENVF